VAAWANCDAATGANAALTVTGLPTDLEKGGSLRTEYRYRVPSQSYTSPAVGFDWYLHNSLTALPGCTTPFTDDQYFAAAKAVSGFDTSSAFPSDGSVKLRNPFVEIPFVNATNTQSVSSFLYDGFANKLTVPLPANLTWKTLSLRHRFVGSPDHTMILARRMYQSRHTACGDDIRFGSGAAAQVGPIDAMRPFENTYMHCDAVVVNRGGRGVCLFGANPVPGTSVPTVRAIDNRITAAPTAGPGMISFNGTTVTLSGGDFTALVPKYLSIPSLDQRWYKVASITNATTLTLQENLGTRLTMSAWGYTTATPVPVLVFPAGYQKLPKDQQFPRIGVPFSPGVTHTKCTTGPTCNDKYPADIFYLPP
jgi:hypothetical protein